MRCAYRKTLNRSRVPHKCQLPNTGRGSRQFVLIAAGGFYPKFYGTMAVFSGYRLLWLYFIKFVRIYLQNM